MTLSNYLSCYQQGFMWPRPRAMRTPAEETSKTQQEYEVFEAICTEPNTALGETLAVVSMLIVFGWVWCGPLLLLGLMYAGIVLNNKLAALALTLVVASTFAHAEYWPQLRQSWIWDVWRRYFPLSVRSPPIPYLDPSKTYLFAHFPHGIFPMGSWLSLSALGTKGTGLPAHSMAAGATALLHLPLVGLLNCWMGLHPADKASVCALLRHHCVGLLPEGIAGIFHGANRDTHIERIFLKQRKGFIKVALETGTDLVPVYVFGQSQVFAYKGLCGASRKLRMSVGLFWGRWGTPVPYKVPLTAVIGLPIVVGKPIEAPSQGQIDELHERFVHALAGLFDQHKASVEGWADRQLLIV